MSKKKINKGYYLELMDRCHVQMESIELFLIRNPHIQANEKMRNKLSKSTGLIFDVYQWAGRKDYEEDEETKA